MFAARSRIAHSLLLAAVALAPLACSEADPNSPATWIAKLQDNEPRKVIDALNKLRTLKAKEAVNNIIPFLKNDDGEISEAAAHALGEIGDKSAVDPLIQAIDLASTRKAADRANAKIADALAMLGDSKAVPDLIKMTNSRVQLVQLHAVEALGKLKDPRAIPILVKFITEEDAPPFITKNAIIALGELKAADAVPELTRALIIERKGISFVLEASFSLMQIGKPAATSVVAIMDGSDKAYLAWAKEHNRLPASYMSKGPLLLGDLADESAVPVLIKALTWEDPDGGRYTDLVRGLAAEALGRMRATAAAGPIAASVVKITDANMRAKYSLALGQLGDKSVLPKLEAATKDKKASLTARGETLKGVAMLGDEKNLPLIDALKKSDPPDGVKKQCIAEAGAEAEKSCDNLARIWREALDNETVRLQAGKDCHDDVACWTKKLTDPAWKVRERAAYELGKAGTVESTKALLAATKDEQTEVLRAVYIALDWATRNSATRELMKQNADALATQYEKDKSSTKLLVVNEDMKRVVWKAKNL